MKAYKVSYNIEQGQFTKDQLLASGKGGCDQVLICSYIEFEDGSGSYAWVSSDGTIPHREMNDDRKLHCMLMLAKQLSESDELYPNAKRMCGEFFEVFRQAKLNAKGKGK